MRSLLRRARWLFLWINRLYTKPRARRTILGLAFFSLFMAVLSADFIPDRMSLQVGQVSEQDVISPRTISYVDQAKTKELEDEVVASVADVYDTDVAAAAKSEENLKAIFAVPRSRLEGQESPEQMKVLLDSLKQKIPIKLPGNVMDALMRLDANDLNLAQTQIAAFLQRYYQRGVRTEELDMIRKQSQFEIKEKGLRSDVETVVLGIAPPLLEPNYIYNAMETEKRRQAALASVEPVRETIRKGQVIVRRGEVVTEDQIRAMEELGMYKSQLGRGRLIGLMVFAASVIALMFGYLYRFAYRIYTNDLQLVLLGLIFLITLAIGKAAHYYSNFAAPMASGALLAAILINPQVGLLASMALAMLFAIIADFDVRAVAAVLISSMYGVYSVYRMAHGYSLIRTGLCIAAANLLVIGSTGLVQQIELPHLTLQVLLGVVSGIASAVITTGLLPYLEHAFNIVTPIKLLDLGQPSQPLMKRLLVEAPGTYHHSLLIGNLAETAADEVGADPVVVRVGAYYHDIGKIRRPYFFVENQFGAENPHDKISPTLSTLIITSHVKDGLELCRRHQIPKVITDIVQQHHGTMLASYFYKRATENEHGGCVVEADFRYEGPKPQTKEAALIMIADACEAAVRSLGKPNVNRVDAMVRKIIRERLNDGQLDECNLTLRDLTTIGDVYTRILSGMFHSRIEYPASLKELERKKEKNGDSIKQLAAGTGSDGASKTNGDGGVKKDG